MNHLESLELLTRAVEAARADIAPGYEEYLQLALAIASDCGEAGRGCFHRLCAFSAKYRQRDAEEMFSNVLRSGRNKVHLGTAFYLARLAGVDVMDEIRIYTPSPKEAKQSAGPANDALDANDAPASFSHTRTREGEMEAAMLEGSEPGTPLPCFPEADWPEPLKEGISLGATPPQRDLLLLALATLFGAAYNRHVRFLYGGHEFSPCLQTFIVAPAASGKGVMADARRVVQPLHEELRKQAAQEKAAYQQAKAKYDCMGKERATMEVPQRPPNRMFCIPGNNTGTGILQNIIDNDGVGLIIEPEADTLSTAIGNDHGRFSDALRKAYDHMWLDYNRRTDEEYREVRKTYLSVLISGTPAQVEPLIPSAENGLFSRQLFYYMPGIKRWQNQFDCQAQNLEAVFTRMGLEWMKVLDEQKQRGVYDLQLSDGQKQRFNDRFARLFDRAGLTQGTEMNSSIIRLAVNLLRILSVVAMLRGDFQPSPTVPADNVKDGIIPCWDVFVREGDFEAVMGLLEPLYLHATHILSLLPGVEVNRRPNSEREVLFAALPDRFTRQMVLDQAALQHINPNTAISWLNRMEKKGVVESTARGEYLFTRARV